MQAIDEYRELAGQDSIIKELLEDAPKLSREEAFSRAAKELEVARQKAKEGAVESEESRRKAEDLKLQIEELERAAAAKDSCE